jgi:hypothetical protein
MESNVIIAELPVAAFATAMLIFTIIMYCGYCRRVKDWYYARSLRTHGSIKKSYTVSWHIMDAFALFFLALCVSGILYIVFGFISDGGILYAISKNTFRGYILLPVIFFWILTFVSFFFVLFISWVLRSEADNKLDEKLKEFEGSLRPLATITDATFSPGDVCESAGRYKVIDQRTRGQRGEIHLRRGETFPEIGNDTVQFVKLN